MTYNHPIERIAPIRQRVEYPEPGPRIPTLQEVLNDVCMAMDEPVKKVASKRRHREFVYCRMIYCYVAKKKVGKSLKNIGALVGGRDHTTVIACLSKFADFMDVKDREFLSQWNRYLERSQLFNKNDFQ